MENIFEKYVEHAMGEYKQAEFKFKQFEINYQEYFPSDKNSNILDIGIGRGEMLSSMKNWGYKKYLGVDISPSTIKFCKSIDLNCELVDDTALWLKKHPTEFDMITLLDVLEHIPRQNTIDFLKAIKGALKKDALLIIQTPNLQAPDGQLHRYNDFTHEFGFVEHSLSQVLLAAGFEQFHFKGFEEFTSGGFSESKRKFFRKYFWEYIRFTRKITNNINPTILNPVFFAVVKNKLD